MLSNVAEFATVRAHSNAAMLNEASRLKAHHVVGSILRPAFCHLRTTRFSGLLESQNVLAVRFATEVDNGHVLGNILLQRDEIDGEVLITEYVLNLDDLASSVEGTTIGADADTKGIEVFRLGGSDELLIGLLCAQLRYAQVVDKMTVCAVHSLVASLTASLALDIRTLGCLVALDIAYFAAAGEGSLDLFVVAVSLVVTVAVLVP